MNSGRDLERRLSRLSRVARLKTLELARRASSPSAETKLGRWWRAVARRSARLCAWLRRLDLGRRGVR